MTLESLRKSIGVVPQDTVSSNNTLHSYFLFDCNYYNFIGGYADLAGSNIITQELVLHDQVLFNDTIYHNIHYGRLSATKEEVWIL